MRYLPGQWLAQMAVALEPARPRDPRAEVAELAHVGEALDRVRCLRNRGFESAALELAESAGARWPEQRSLKAARADLLVRLRRLPEARALLDQVLAEDPEHQGALVAQGDLASATGRLEAAEAAYRAATRARGALGYAPHLVRRHARVLERLGRVDEALAVLDRGLSARCRGRSKANRMQLAGLEVTRGWVLVRAGRMDEAGALAEALAARLPEDAGAKRLVYETRTRARPPEEVARELDAALSTAAGQANTQLWVVRARRAAEAGAWLRAAESWLAAFALEPARSATRRQAGFAFKRAGDLARAVACLEPEFLADPGDVFVRGCLLCCLSDMAESGRALALVERALLENPGVKGLHGVRRKLARGAGAGTTGGAPAGTAKAPAAVSSMGSCQGRLF